MTDPSGQVAAVGRRRGPRRASGRVLAGRGDTWELWVPLDLWERMTEKERADLVEGQAALLRESRRRG